MNSSSIPIVGFSGGDGAIDVVVLSQWCLSPKALIEQTYVYGKGTFSHVHGCAGQGLLLRLITKW
jgi:hypothetical protein